MVKIVGKTLVADEDFQFELEPSMMTKSLAHHFFEQRKRKSYPGFDSQALLVNARNSQQDVIYGPDIEIKSR
jgi:hypothetical protein